MMRTLNLEVVEGSDERLNSSLSAYRSAVQCTLNYAITNQVKSYFKLNSMLYRELLEVFKASANLLQNAMRRALLIYGSGGGKSV